jgi:hypothetical protein
LATVAAKTEVAPVCTDLFGENVVITTEIAPAVPMAMLALALLLVSVTEIAVMITRPVDGMLAGAVYVVLAPLAVCVGLNEPQVLAGAQLQVTPAFAESLPTVAAIGAVAPIFSEAGGGVLRDTETGAPIDTVALTLFVGSWVDVAVMVTCPFCGTVAGAV